MKATHIDYMHKGHLRVVDGKTHLCFDGRGYYETDALCVAPSTQLYKDLNKKGLPKWPEGQARTVAKMRPDLDEQLQEYVESLRKDREAAGQL